MRLRLHLFLFIIYFLSVYKFPISLGASSGMYVGIDFLLDCLILIFSIISIRSSPLSVKISFIIIVVSSVFSYLVQNVSLESYLNGVRETFIIPLIISFYFETLESMYFKSFFKEFKRFCWFFLIVQFPCSIYQYIKYGPSDYVGGSLGPYCSGLQTFLIFLFVFILFLDAKRDIKRLIVLPFLLFPAFINETKIVFLLIPMLIFGVTFGRISKASFLAMALLFVIVSYSFSSIGNFNSWKEIFSEEYLQYYFFSDDESQIDMPRMTKIHYGIELLSNNYSGMLFGLDYGCFKGGKFMQKSEFALLNDWLLTGSRPYLFFLFMSGGMILAITTIYIVFRVMIISIKHVVLELNEKGVFIFIFILILFYNDSFRDRFFSMCFFGALFFLLSNKKMLKSSA